MINLQIHEGGTEIIDTGNLIDFDENDLKDVELDQIIRVADYFQMTDLVTVLSDLMKANITKENLQEMINFSQEIQVPNLKKACMKFIRDDIMDISLMRNDEVKEDDSIYMSLVQKNLKILT